MIPILGNIDIIMTANFIISGNTIIIMCGVLYHILYEL